MNGTLALLFVIAIFISLSGCATGLAPLFTSRLVPHYTLFAWRSPEVLDAKGNVILDEQDHVLRFEGFTIGSNLMMSEAGGVAGSDIYYTFQRPSKRSHTPQHPDFKDHWYKLQVLDIDSIPGDSSHPEFSPLPDDGTELFRAIFGARAIVESFTEQEYSAFRDTLNGLTIRTINMTLILADLATQDGAVFPMGIVGGATRDFLTGKAKDINDIDVATSQPYSDLVYRLRDVFNLKGVPIDDTVLQHQGIRQEYGLMKVQKVETDPDGLDIGPMKSSLTAFFTNAGDNPFCQPLKYTNGKSFSPEEEVNHYVYGYSFLLDSQSRDFTFNSIYFDFFSPTPRKISIDSNGLSDASSSLPLVRFANPTSFTLDVGGWFRYFRFIGPPSTLTKFKGYGRLPGDAETVCSYLYLTSLELLDHGVDDSSARSVQFQTGYNIRGFFLKMKKKLVAADGANVVDVLEALKTSMASVQSKVCNCAWNAIVELANDEQTEQYFHFANGDSQEERVTVTMVSLLRDFPKLPCETQKKTLWMFENTAPAIHRVHTSTNVSTAIASQYQCFVTSAILNGHQAMSDSPLWHDKRTKDQGQTPVQPNPETYSDLPTGTGVDAPAEDEDVDWVATVTSPRWTDMVLYTQNSKESLFFYKMLLYVAALTDSIPGSSPALQSIGTLLLNGDPFALRTRSFPLEISHAQLEAEMQGFVASLHSQQLSDGICAFRQAYRANTSLIQWIEFSDLAVAAAPTPVSVHRMVLATRIDVSAHWVFSVNTVGSVVWSTYFFADPSQATAARPLVSTDVVEAFLDVVYCGESLSDTSLLSPQDQQILANMLSTAKLSSQGLCQAFSHGSTLYPSLFVWVLSLVSLFRDLLLG